MRNRVADGVVAVGVPGVAAESRDGQSQADGLLEILGAGKPCRGV